MVGGFLMAVAALLEGRKQAEPPPATRLCRRMQSEDWTSATIVARHEPFTYSEGELVTQAHKAVGLAHQVRFADIHCYDRQPILA